MNEYKHYKCYNYPKYCDVCYRLTYKEELTVRNTYYGNKSHQYDEYIYDTVLVGVSPYDLRHISQHKIQDEHKYYHPGDRKYIVESPGSVSDTHEIRSIIYFFLG